MPELREEVVGRYVLFDEIAAGGMATVHLGRLIGPVGFSRTVAIKRLHPGYAKDQAFVSMFVDEARLAARIRHPNVVPVLDVVFTTDELFLVMEYIQGESLARLLQLARRRRQPVPSIHVGAIITGVLHGLHAAHEARGENGAPLHIVHRDVSPHNVLVGVDGVPRIFDFGIAKARGRLQTTAEGQVKGKIPYMSPEQIGGGTMGREVDIYAAGVVLWEALTGKRLFEGETDVMLLANVLAGAKVPPSEFVVDLPPGIDDVVMKALSVDPAGRFATARDMALAIEECLAVASATQLGEWVQQAATESLQVRSNRVAAIESHPGLSTPPPGSQPGLVSMPEQVEITTATDVGIVGHGGASADGLLEPTALLSDVAVITSTGGADVAASDDPNSLMYGDTKFVGVPELVSRRRRRLLWLAAGLIASALLMGGALAALTYDPPQGEPGSSSIGSDEVAATVDEARATGDRTGDGTEETGGMAATAGSGGGAEPAVSSSASRSGGSGGAPATASRRPTPRPGARAPTTPTAGLRQPSGAPTAAAAKADCNPPYTIDSRGIQRLKSECL